MTLQIYGPTLVVCSVYGMKSYCRILRGDEYLQIKMGEANESKVDEESQVYDYSEVEALVRG